MLERTVLNLSGTPGWGLATPPTPSAGLRSDRSHSRFVPGLALRAPGLRSGCGWWRRNDVARLDCRLAHQVLDCGAQEEDAVLKGAEPEVALSADEAAHVASLMVVIDSQPAL